MPRLRHAVTGVVVSVSDDTAARLGNEWIPADSEPTPRRGPARKRAVKATSQE